MSAYWTYVVDHPQRDLACFSWWSFNSLFHANDDICLIPMSELDADFLLNQKPDVIVWNYIRVNNLTIIKKAKQLGIYNRA